MTKISIIMPVLNEAELVERSLAAIEKTPDLEIVVVDGGSQDGTVELAKAANVKVFSAPAGRARQMNAGAAAATGEILLFLHADTRLPAGFEMLVHQSLERPGSVAGAFRLQIDGSMPCLRAIELGVNWRSRLLGLPYGDQAIFLPATVFKEIGGFPDLPIMEDFELIGRLKRRGRIAIAPARAITSARRWQKLGIWKTTAINQLAIAAYLLGVSPHRIARWYSRNRRNS